jgi:acetyl-CoA C-acetyltransferase
MTAYSHDKRPVIIGIGQSVHRSAEPAEIKSPVELIEMAVREAEADSHAKALIQKVDTLCLVNILSNQYDDPLSELSKRIGIKPKHQAYTWVGATAPQWFVNQTAEQIISGKARIGLISGGEAFHSKKIEAKAKGTAFRQWDFPPKKPWMAGDLRDPLTELEMKYGLILPIHIYPLFENALRHHESLSIEKHRKELGELCAAFSSIAAENPYAWFKSRKSCDQITTPGDSNPMAAFPYTRSMCSIMQVDQAAALFMTDEQTAIELGVPRDKWIYLLGSGDASDIWHVSERINFFSSPSVKVAAEKAMEQADVSLQEIDYLDLYSCFPCAARMVRNMLEIPKNDPRPLTVTGAMPYFGGPGNNYSLHSICRMVELLRQGQDKVGLVHALSWFISKHSVGIYAGQGKDKPKRRIPPESYQAGLNKLKGPPFIEDASGNAVVETYTLFHDRSGQPIDAVIIGRLDNGSRFLAKPEKDKDLLVAMMKNEFIGTQGKVRSKDGFNIFLF